MLRLRFLRFSQKSMGRSRHTSSSVRRQFLDFFKEEDHTFIRSSPVVPFNDPSLTFVNAGMNQFKAVLQNKAVPPASSVYNSQKCIRVGGKHNDLSEVGSDGSHLTMFEMLGSWSFGSYWKQEACRMAWELITSRYRLEPQRLYVTYFGGCAKSGLPPDKEVRDVWLNLGVPDSHILPFGMKDNFWEMGASGPCGPCTEIHYDHGGKGAQYVNAGTPDNIEIWNLVFVEYDRSLEGSLSPLQTRHVDTGMGLERLVAVLNQSSSSFDTDLFQPLFKTIHDVSGRPEYSGRFGEGADLDTAYRILADHARMIIVCLGDRVFPDQNHKLKYVMRRALNISKQVFGVQQGIFQDLYAPIADSLGETFPEIVKNEESIKMILDFEEESYKKFLEKNSKYNSMLKKEYSKEYKLINIEESVNFYESLKLLDSENVSGFISPQLAYKMYESHGMQESDIVKLAQIRNLDFDHHQFNVYFDEKKELSKISSAQAEDMKTVLKLKTKLPPTDDSEKYNFSRKDGEYVFSECEGRILSLVNSGADTTHLKEGEDGVVFLDKTCFYGEAGGQVGDRGTLVSSGGEFVVTNTQIVHSNLVAHLGKMRSGRLQQDDVVTGRIDPSWRFRCMQNHTGTHVLNLVLNSLLPVTSQRSSLVDSQHFRFDFSVFQADVNTEFLKQMEDRFLQAIQANLLVDRRTVDSDQLVHVENLVTLPGEVYPPIVSLIHIGPQCEPCCGTHLLETGDIGNFAIVSCKTASAGVKSLKCLTGEAAKLAREHGIEVCEEILAIQETIEDDCDKFTLEKINEINSQISRWKSAISKSDFPVVLSLELGRVLDTYQKRIKLSERSLKMTASTEQMELAVEKQANKPFLVTLLQFEGKNNFSLIKAAKMVDRKPSLIFSLGNGELKGKAMVPADLASNQFNARLWMSVVLDNLGGKGAAPRGQDPTLHFNMKVMSIQNTSKLQKLLKNADKFAEEYFKESREGR